MATAAQESRMCMIRPDGVSDMNQRNDTEISISAE